MESICNKVVSIDFTKFLQKTLKFARFLLCLKNFPNFRALASALEVIPRTLAQNCGANTIRTLTTLRAKHAEGNNSTFGVNGLSGKIEDMKQLGIYEPLAVKLQVYKTAVETAILLLRIDDIVSGSKKKDDGAGGPTSAPMPE